MLRGLSLRAAIAIPVEIRVESRRVFRLAADVGEDGLRLHREAPFEPGRPVEARFALPGGDEPLSLRAELVAEGCGLRFVDAPSSARAAIHRYVRDRLGLPR
jgi:hypothetical protein